MTLPHIPEGLSNVPLSPLICGVGNFTNVVFPTLDLIIEGESTSQASTREDSPNEDSTIQASIGEDSTRERDDEWPITLGIIIEG